ncbi:1231_t:CDS:1 [Gigaspora margarita]|uniref:Multifunctional tryptophan biosynthesis protein n=1 Tax=Gigaspora margarita TaxID=4874 RepID=A0ABN7VJ98_GIGMA|nr:1231_t:CDS:1 [Gigaspora margarita]
MSSPSKSSEITPTNSTLTILIDNYDSFTWNIYQYLSELGAEVQVFRNDQITVEQIEDLCPKNIIISPGPGGPSANVGISRDVISSFAGIVPILGVCLGEQCIVEVFGGKVEYAGEIVHGKTSTIKHDGKGVYTNVPNEISATRYHSLAAQPQTIPDDLEITSWSETNVIMGVRHRDYTIEGIQFHPESILSEHGKTILGNFLKLQGGKWDDNPKFCVKSPLAKTFVQKNSIPSILEKIRNQRLTDIKLAKKQPGCSSRDYEKLLSLHATHPLIDFVSRIKQTLPKYPAIFAEVKRASPSKGNIDPSANAAEQALKYAKAGASVISVLTESKWFKGSLNDMRQVRDVLATIPNRPAILRKDFILDTYQIMEARLFGADTILLIVAILTDDQLTKLYKFSKHLGMEPLVEVNNREEMERAVKLGAKVIGVNNRNLHTFDVDMNTTSMLADMVPEGVILAALSGITGRDDVVTYRKQGVKALLIGEALMKAKNKRTFIHELLELEESPKPTVKVKAPPSPLVKICGVSTVDAAIAAADAGADFIGLIFAKSKRQVQIDQALEIVSVIREIQSEKAQDKIELTEQSQEDVIKLSGNDDWFKLQASRINNSRKPLLVGVFQNQSLEYITNILDHLKLDLVQLHGDEPLDMAKFLPVPVIKAFHVDNDFTNPTLVTQPGYNALCLLDTKVPLVSNDKEEEVEENKKYIPAGGSGKTFDWNIALKIKESVSKKRIGGKNGFPLILAGGLTPSNVIKAIEKVKPWAVDVSSGVETDGEKDLEKIKDFITNAKSFVYDDDDDDYNDEEDYCEVVGAYEGGENGYDKDGRDDEKDDEQIKQKEDGEIGVAQ